MSTSSQIPKHIINMANYDAHSIEAMDQTLLNLSNLEEIGSDIFNKIFTKIQAVHEKMKNISERINASKSKIDQLNNVSKAIVIQSPTKYIKTFNQNDLEQNKNLFAEYMLIPHLYKTDQSIFAKVQQFLNLIKNFKIKQHHTPQEQGKPAEVAKLDEYLRMVNSLYGKIKQKKKLFEGRDAIQNQVLEGLGTIPKNLQYIDSLLVFNSSQNPYSHYTSFDNMKMAETNTKQKAQKQQEQEDLQQNAPTLITERITLQQSQQQKYHFKPQAKAAPQIAMSGKLQLDGIIDFQQIEEEQDDPNEIFATQGDRLKKVFESDDPAMDLDNNLTANAQTTNHVGEELLQAQMHVGQIKSKANNLASQVPKEEPKQYFVFNTFQNQSSSSQPSQPQAQAQPSQSQTTNLLAMPAPINIPQAPTLSLNLSVAPSPPQPPSLSIQMPSAPGAPVPPPLTINPGAPAPPPIGAPKLNLPAPKAPTAAAKPAAAGEGRADLLASIRCADPMARLKKVSKLMEEGKPLPPVDKNKDNPAKAPPKKQSHMELLRQQVMLRAGALNRKNKKKDSSDESDSD